jgi:hypothetical protein
VVSFPFTVVAPGAVVTFPSTVVAPGAVVTFPSTVVAPVVAPSLIFVVVVGTFGVVVGTLGLVVGTLGLVVGVILERLKGGIVGNRRFHPSLNPSNELLLNGMRETTQTAIINNPRIVISLVFIIRPIYSNGIFY